MSRGAGLYASYIETPQRGGEKGQRNAFIDERDEAICYRFHYYGNHCRKGFEDILDILSREFFLAPSTIVTRLNQSTETLDYIKATKPEIKSIARKYPWFTWSVMRT